jgi:hypothetical protein
LAATTLSKSLPESSVAEVTDAVEATIDDVEGEAAAGKVVVPDALRQTLRFPSLPDHGIIRRNIARVEQRTALTERATLARLFPAIPQLSSPR